MAQTHDERKTLDLIKNHAEFKGTLVSLGMDFTVPVLEGHVRAVALRGFELARMHYVDGKALNSANNPRAVYSRAYYAAYNASKAVRYIVRGFVSLRGDDHKKVADLPSSFPDVDSWASKLPLLYEHRLRADYDNWSNTGAENVWQPSECLAVAGEFLETAENFLRSDYGLVL